VTENELVSRGAKPFWNAHYSESFIRALVSLYPEHPWEIFKFAQKPARYWSKIQNQRVYMDWLGKELGITQNSDWYNVRVVDLYKKGAGSLLVKYKGSLIRGTSLYDSSFLHS